jgi:hypothetical protein
VASIEYRRRDLVVVIRQSGLSAQFAGEQAALPIGSLDKMAAALAQTQVWKSWASVVASKSNTFLPRICLDFRFLGLSSGPWEEALLPLTRKALPGCIVVRVSPVRPRCANF